MDQYETQKIYTRQLGALNSLLIIKELSIAFREFGANPQKSNPRLRNVLINVKGLNIPKDTLKNHLKRSLVVIVIIIGKSILRDTDLTV